MGKEVEAVGVKESLDMVIFLMLFGNAFGFAFEDGKVSWDDAKYLIDPLKAGVPAFIGISEIPKEAADYSTEEIAEMVRVGCETLKLPQENVEKLVEVWLAAVPFFAKAMAVSIQFAKERKKAKV